MQGIQKRDKVNNLKRLFLKMSFLGTLSIALIPSLSAQTFKPVTGKSPEFRVEPHSLRDGSLITLISPSEWAGVGNRISKTLINAHNQLSEEFGTLNSINTYVRIMPERTFFNTTGAPEWTNALFYRGQIYIPINKSKADDTDNLNRSAKHEYVHAVFHALSNGKCPGWLDEGFAQLSEGSENPVLRPSLVRFLKDNKPIPLSDLQGGFTKLPNEKVAAAYAQSLVISQMLKESFGLKSVRNYLERLSLGYSSKDAFSYAFGISEAHFEDLIQTSLEQWTLGL